MSRATSRAVIVASITLVTALTFAAAAYLALVSYRPGLRDGEAYGVDVSHHQGRINWEAAAGDDITYAYIKATEGETVIDAQFDENWSESAAAGVSRGAYHFFSLCSTGRAQAQNFLATVPDDPAALPPAVDLEFSACRERPDPATVEEDLRQFIDTVESARGVQVVVYVLPEFARTYPFAAELDRDSWVRRLYRRPEEEFALWQVSNTARVAGIDGMTDLNVWAARPAAADR